MRLYQRNIGKHVDTKKTVRELREFPIRDQKRFVSAGTFFLGQAEVLVMFPALFAR